MLGGDGSQVKMRLQKCLAEAGVASRRAGEQFILAGRVQVNGEPVCRLGVTVDPAQDRVTVDGAVIRLRRKVYLALNKPPGYLCTRLDPQRRRTFADCLPREWSDLYTVGRLDQESEGLILVTNDGDFCLRATHPRYGVRKKYIVTVRGRVEPRLLGQMTQGVVEGGERLRAGKARLLESNNSHSLLELELTEGKNREVRRLLLTLGLSVERLQRIQIGSIKLGELPTGKWRTLTEPEIHSLLPKR